jgi:hypothetical protein
MTGFELSQTHYIQVTLKELKFKRLYTHKLPLVNRVIKVLLSEHIMRLPTLSSCKITLYQCIIDKFLYTVMCTCFDITFSIDMLGRYSHILNSHHMTMVKYVLGYLKYTLNVKLVYRKNDSKKVTAYTYVDTDFANVLGRKLVL